MNQSTTSMPTDRYSSAMRTAQARALESSEDVLLVGENVGRMGGARGASIGLLERFGPKRVIDTPISDSATVGLAAGLALAGKKVIVELTGPDRLADAWECLRLELANLEERTQGAFESTVVIRVPCGPGLGGGRYNEASPEGNLSTIAGLRVFSPRSGVEAGNLLVHALTLRGPSVILEANTLTQIHDKGPSDFAAGDSVLLREGEDLTLLCTGATAPLALRLHQLCEQEGIEPEVLHLRSLRPLDTEGLKTSVQKTGRCLLLSDSDALSNHLMGQITDLAFLHLESPPRGSSSIQPEALMDLVGEILDY